MRTIGAVWFSLLTTGVSFALIFSKGVEASQPVEIHEATTLVGRFSETVAELRNIQVGKQIEVEGLILEGHANNVEVKLRRVKVFTDDAEIVVHSDHGDRLFGPPNNSYFVGTVKGTERSRVYISLKPQGEIVGLIFSDGLAWVLEENSKVNSMIFRRASFSDSKSAAAGFACDADLLAPSVEPLERLFPSQADNASDAPRLIKASASYTARVAVETDHEFYQIFGNVSDATDYVGDVIGYASSIYADEIDTTLLISHLSLWTSSSDPWTQTSTICGLFEFGKYWNYNRTGVTRSLAHFMSGKSLGGGIAWTGVLCESQFNPSIWGYTPSAFGCGGLTPDSDYYGGAYGFTANINGSFDAANPGPMWDIISVSHEIGHNFNSPHTHCYKNLGGNANPIDECWSSECSGSCNCNAPTLPCAQSGAGCGTIMSYCHQLGGGYNNISLTFGAGHPYGIAPERVPARMYSHVLSAAASDPLCLAYEEVHALFSDGFEFGNTNAWSSRAP